MTTVLRSRYSKTPRRRLEVRVRNVAGQLVLAHQESTVSLSETAEAIWRRVDAKSTVWDISAYVAERYGLATEDVVGDVDGWLAEMQRAGFVSWHDAIVERIPGPPCETSTPHVPGVGPSLALLQNLRMVPDGAECLYVTGSHARGWNHALSDRDFVVVSSAESTERLFERHLDTAARIPIHTEVRFVEGTRWEVKYWTSQQIWDAIDRVSWQAFDEGTTTGSLNREEHVLLDRMRHGLPLTGADWLQATSAAIAQSAMRTVSALDALAQVDSDLEDLAGLWSSGATDSAIAAAREALDHAVDALNASLGECGREPKWRVQRLAAVASPLLSTVEYTDAATMRDFDASDPDEWLGRVAALCQKIVLDIKLGR